MPRRPTRPITALVAALALSAGAAACSEVEAPTGPPRCEPEPELWLERTLREAYAALAEGEIETAEALFDRVLDTEAQHPEALLGKSRVALYAPPRGSAHVGVVRIAGEEMHVPIPITHHLYSFESLQALAPFRPRGSGAARRWFKEREASSPVSAVDLVVLHDTRTHTAAEAFSALESSGASTHFLIDADGSIFQTLDLALEANHTREAALDGRSLAIDLVNPVTLDSPPDPDVERAHPRPLSDFVSLQGQEPVQHRGYTEAQLAALEALLEALCARLPALPCALPPATPSGGLPRERLKDPGRFRGVAGHLHLSATALDPGAGFPWERLQQRLAPGGEARPNAGP